MLRVTRVRQRRLILVLLDETMVVTQLAGAIHTLVVDVSRHVNCADVRVNFDVVKLGAVLQ